MAVQQEQKPLLGDQTGNPIIQALTEERDNLDDAFFNAKKLLNEEIQKEQGGKKNGVASNDKIVSVVPEANANGINCRVRIPVREFPKVNFVGKLLGPKGSTLKQLQLDTGTRMSILGRGSMRGKDKEEELRTGGDPKYAHLNMDLHVLVEAAPCPPSEAFSRIGHALTELKKFLTPEEGEEYGRQGPMLGVAPPGAPRGGRGRARGGPPGRGMPMPLGGAPGAQRGRPAYPGARGAPRGAVRGRGAPPGRGRAAPRPPANYGQQEEYYEESGYGETYAEAGYEEGAAEATTYGYAAETGAGDGYEYSSYGGASQTSYGGQAPASSGGSYGGYVGNGGDSSSHDIAISQRVPKHSGSGGGSSWSSGGPAGGARQQMKAPTQYTQKPAQRAHPYARY